MTRLKRADTIAIGDRLIGNREVTAIRPVLTTSAGRPRRRPPVQLTIESRAMDSRALYADTVYCTSLIRLEP